MERNMDESRKAFEQWYLLNWGHTEDNHETLFEIGPGDDSYYRLGVRLAYEAWLASRAAIDIELPKPSSMLNRLNFNSTYHSVNAFKAEDVEYSIRAAGIKVKE
nr:MAG TPA: hypothetical protein [Caudoviricetes sp.]